MTSTALTAATQTAAAKPEIRKGGVLQALVPETLDDAFRLAKALSLSGDMVPKHFQNKPEATMAAIVRGMEVGLAPMQALSHIAVINGRACLWGDAIPALLQRAGHHIDVDYEGAGDSLVAVATLTRGDTGKKVVRRFGIADAKRAGLLGKQGPWQQYPQRMCAHRARTWAARDGASDALMGLQIAEEVSDYGPDRARDVTPAPRRGGVVYAEPDDEILEHGDAARDDDPFGLPPVDTDLTPEQRAELEAAERAVLDQQREAEE
ncbi:MAG TPA: hypothetical protein DEB47_17585 [Citreicella sp.]|nr:hypothetical protein [Citreicella sp.]